MSVSGLRGMPASVSTSIGSGRPVSLRFLKRSKGLLLSLYAQQHEARPNGRASLSPQRALPEAHDESALTLGRLLRLRLDRSWRVRSSGEQVVPNRRDELRRDANPRRLLVVVGKAE
jgi:hypothetical protein